MAEPAAATPFGRYQLIRRIARGGMAEIFLAKQQGPGRFERSLVIKRILPHLVGQGEQFTQMFLDEASLAAQLSHPHIAQVYDFGHEDGTYFIALELVKGPDLRQIVRTAQRLGLEPPPVELSVKIIAEVLGALDFAHHAKSESGAALNIVHRDVSPQNVLVSYDGVTKLVDFGIAKAATSGTETEAGVVKGKYAYFAPEQIKKVPLDGRTDEYAAALVLYELLTLQQALPGEGMEAILAAAEGRIQPIDEVRPDLPPELVKVLKKALSLDRDKRYRTCRDLQVALEELLVGWGLAVQPHDIARYIAELEQQAGEPLSAAVAAQGHTPSSPARVETGPRAQERRIDPQTGPAPAGEARTAPRLRTGTRPAVGPPRAAEPAPTPAEDLNGPTVLQMEAGAEPPPPAPKPRARTGVRKALEPMGSNETLIKARVPAGLDIGDESTARKPPPRQRSTPAQRPVEAEPTVPERDAEPTPVPAPSRAAEKTPTRKPVPKRTAAAEEKSGGGGWLGTLVVLVLVFAAGAAAVGYAFGLRPADFKGVHTVPQAMAVIEAKLADKPPVTEAKPLPKPPAPPPQPAAPLVPAAVAQAPSALTGPGGTTGAATPPAAAEAKPAEAQPKHKPHVAKAAAEPPPPEPPPAPTTGTVVFSAKPWAEVTVNGRHLGTSPLPAQELAPGNYTVEFTNPTAPQPVTRKFTVVAGQQQTIAVDMGAP